MFGTLVSGDSERGGVFAVDARRPRGEVDTHVNRDCRWLLLRTRRARLLRTMPVARATRILKMENMIRVMLMVVGDTKGRKNRGKIGVVVNSRRPAQ